MKICMIGWFTPNKFGAGLAKEFELMGHEVYRFSTDQNTKDIVAVDYILFNHIQEPHKHRVARIILKQHLPEQSFDWIFLGQSNVLFDCKDITIPIYYYHKELLYLHFPINSNFMGLFYSFYKGYEHLYFIYTPEMSAMRIHRYLPYAISESLFENIKPKDRRKLIGFKGSLIFPNGQSNDNYMNEIYENRFRFVMYLNAKYPNDFEYEPRDTITSIQKWIEYLTTIDVGLNIPGKWGWVNERMFFICAAKAILLQWRYPYLEENEGFIDFKNCLLFSNEAELDYKIQWIKTHPTELEQIRENGYNHVMKNHTWKQRAEIVIDTVKTTIGSELK